MHEPQRTALVWTRLCDNVAYVCSSKVDLQYTKSLHMQYIISAIILKKTWQYHFDCKHSREYNHKVRISIQQEQQVDQFKT